MKFDDRLTKQVRRHPYRLLFTTISGAHLYGFPSADSDFDLRGVHVLPLSAVVGLEMGEETVDKSEVDDGLEIDLVTHDIKKFFHLMRTGTVEANLVRLNETANLPYIAELELAHQVSRLPEAPSAKAALNDLMQRVRVKD